MVLVFSLPEKRDWWLARGFMATCNIVANYAKTSLEFVTDHTDILFYPIICDGSRHETEAAAPSNKRLTDPTSVLAKIAERKW